MEINNKFYLLGKASNPVYLFGQGDNYVLVEGGISAISGVVLEQLKAILPSLNTINSWIITHSHYDHCGMLPYLYEHLPNAKIYASQETVNVFADSIQYAKIHEWNRLVEEQPSYNSTFPNLKSGIIYEEINYQIVKDGDQLDVNLQHPLSIMRTPGHSKCSLSIYNPNDDVFFVSDALGEFYDTSTFPLIFDNYDNYIDSIHKIKSVGASFIAPGHHLLLKGKKALSAPQQCLDDCDRLLDIIRRQLKLHYSEQQIAQNIISLHNNNKNDFIPAELYFLSMLRMVKIIKKKLHYETSIK